MKYHNEHFLQYVWKLQQFKRQDSNPDIDLEIIHPGFQNKHSGPDFFNAKVKINDTIWAGNVEIHSHSSEWYKHGHHKDSAYNNTILHVVEKHDKTIYNSSGREIPTIEISANKHLTENFTKLQESPSEIACYSDIKTISPFEIRLCVEKMRIERLESRTELITDILNRSKNNWQTTFYILIARSFGMGINSEPFQLLAENLPLNLFAKHKDSLFQIETLLFGQAGMLTDATDEYHQLMCKEYRFLKKKYSLTAIEPSSWKFAKTHPSNFPTLRIAQFAYLLHKSQSLFSKIIELEKLDEIRSLFSVSMSEYWHTHHRFGSVSKRKHKKAGKTTIDKILINAVIPIMFVYGRKKNEEEFQTRAIKLLEQIEVEHNFIINSWEAIGFNAENAADSQGLIHLYKNYCQPRLCLNCCIGNKIVQKQL